MKDVERYFRQMEVRHQIREVLVFSFICMLIFVGWYFILMPDHVVLIFTDDPASGDKFTPVLTHLIIVDITVKVIMCVVCWTFAMTTFFDYATEQTPPPALYVRPARRCTG